MPHFSSFSSLFSFLFLHLLLKFASSAFGGNETDRLALLDFKAKVTHDPLGALSSWNNSLHFCQWKGVTCGARHQRIVDLDLRSSNLVGSISPYVWNLTFLRGLHLQSNSFANELSPNIGRLRRLRILNLNNNSIPGIIPANISNCKGLTTLALSDNKLAGKLPSELGELRNLQILVAANNALVGEIPSSFGNLTFLSSLSLATNHLGGTLPPSLGQLKYFSFFELGVNELTGTIPSSIFNLSLMDTFDVQQNHLQGSLPPDLFLTQPKLIFFNILSNHFTGPIPSSLSNASNLEHFFIYTNNFTGKVPNLQNLPNLQRLSLTTNHLGTGDDGDLSFISSLTNASNLLKLSLNNNNFGGFIPESISNLSTTLTFLLLDNNRLHGTITCGASNLVNLTRLEIWENKLSGAIPECLGKLGKLEVLFLNDNEFAGKIPSFLSELVFLNSLDLGRNKLEGNIPSSLAKCQRLMLLDLSVNNLTGNIPSQLFTLSSLSIALILSHNQLSGSLPSEVSSLQNLGILNVSNNRLSGEMPSSLSSCVSLEVLDMSGNFFNGTIPSSWSSLRGLRSLDLSRNDLSGSIPGFLGALDVKILNLSRNGLAGMVPDEGVFKNASAVSLEGNGKLCGGVAELHFPKCGIENPKTLDLKKYLILGVTALFVGAMLVSCGVVFCCFGRRRRRGGSGGTEDPMFQMSYRTLSEATDGFSPDNLTGRGGFGCVYRGRLSEDDNVVAVKVFNLVKKGGSRSFMVECNALRNIRHRNLVKVVTACSSLDAQGNDFKAIVYEFMANGSLDEWLHPKPPTRKLNFLQRLNISIDVASALDYLHNQCHTTIVHCDLKPSNVLLDEDTVAHVGDFGLMKVFSETSHDLPANHGNSIGVRGTVGYTAPEYGMGSEVATSGDMYSYGILVLEMFTGKRPTDDMFTADTNLRSYVNTALPEKLEEVMDPALREEIESYELCDEVDVEKVNESLVSILGIGIACSEEAPRERMSVRDASAKLVAIRDKVVRTGKKVGDMKKSELESRL